MKRDYPSVLPGRRRSALPTDLQWALQRLGKTLHKAIARRSDVASVIDALAALPPGNISAIAGDLALYGELFSPGVPWLPMVLRQTATESRLDCLKRIPGLKWLLSLRRTGLESQVDCLKRTPGLEWLFLFHGNGYLRQAALRKVAGPLNSSFMLAAVLYRLNDWVPEVRREAMITALRVFDTTSAEIVLPAVIGVLELRHQWRRGLSEAVIVDEVLSRADIHAAMTDYLTLANTGPAARILTNLLRDNRFDPDLPILLKASRHPAVRALALRTLIRQEARWPVGMKIEWIDKSMGKGRRVPDFATRAVSSPSPLEEFIEAGAADRVVAVRKVAMQGLIDHPEAWARQAEVIKRLSQDRSAAIRQGIGYIQARQAR